MVKLTRECSGRIGRPACGCCAITRPRRALRERAWEIRPTEQSALTMAARAFLAVRPRSRGTRQPGVVNAPEDSPVLPTLSVAVTFQLCLPGDQRREGA